MISTSEITKDLEADKKQLLIELYLKEKFKERFNPAWLETMENYAHLGTAIDFFYKLNNENLNLIAVGSKNADTRLTHAKQFKDLATLLDKLVVLTDDTPPVATSFKAKDAALAGIELSQAMAGRSLRDLHAQSNNLGIAEKLLNEELGQTEWLGEVDLERMLIKLGIKDRTHITRLNTEDIGMILHFERVKHADATEPYTIPLLINCGSSGSLRSQGNHWTFAMVTVNPTTTAITIDYQDSMPLNQTEEAILTNAINYQDGAYSAFSTYATKTVNVESDDLQTDGWSCGYRALKGLITAPGFPVTGGVNLSPDWLRLTGAATESYALRNAIYESLLSGVVIDQDYFAAMKLDDQMVKSSSTGKNYELDSGFTEHYLKLLSGSRQTSAITTEKFGKEFQEIWKNITKITFHTARMDTLDGLIKQFNGVSKNSLLTSDAKIMAVLNIFFTTYAEILGTRGGKNSYLAKTISEFCLENFGVEFGVGLGGEPRYRVKPEGLAARVLNQVVTNHPKNVEGEPLLPPVKRRGTEPAYTSASAPVIASIKPLSRVTPSVDVIKTKPAVDSNQPALRVDKRLTRLGTMFGIQQFCYANKPSGVEPGFRAIDLNDLFFKALDKILRENLSSTTKVPEEDKLALISLREKLITADLGEKRVLFAAFVNSQVPGPHGGDRLNARMQWMCDEIKGSVSTNNNLSAWMYKLDYADGQKDRVKANKEAIREFVGTRLAGIFSTQNQKQEIAWVKNGEKGMHALLACGWKNGLKELTQFLHGGGEPDYNGVLVEDKTAEVKRSKQIPGLGKNLIFGIAIGDRDGMGKDAQNKGFADGQFYGFDYGKPYEGGGVCASISDDFSFEDSYAKAPALFRGSSKIGVARHFMYRNYSTFYDTPLAERMEGFHLFRKMITGENPSEEVIKSFPGLRQELHRIQENTPAALDMVNQLVEMRGACNERDPFAALIEKQILQLYSGTLSNFDLYFTKMKIDLMDVAIKNQMPYEEFTGYMKFIDEMALQAHKSNQSILAAFAQRQALPKQEIDLLDRLEKIFSPTAVMSHDGTVFLNTMRFESQESRVPFQLKKEENGTYTLSTTDKAIAPKLKEKWGISTVQSETGLSCTLTQENLIKLMAVAEVQYNQKREDLLVKPTYQYITLPHLVELLNKNNSAHDVKINIGFMWRKDDSLSFRIIAKTEAQALKVEEILGKKVRVGHAEIIDIPAGKVKDLGKTIQEAYDLAQVKAEALDQPITHSAGLVPQERAAKWARLYEQADVEGFTTMPVVDPLIERYSALIREEGLLAQIKDALIEISDPAMIEKLMQANDKTLTNPENIKAIIEERCKDIKEISDELTITTDAPAEVSTVQRTINI